MKTVYLLKLMLVVGSLLPAAAQDCAKLGGTWSVYENVFLKYCSAGKCETSIHGGETTVLVTMATNSNCSFSFKSTAVDPQTGNTTTLDRTGSVSCAEVYYQGPAGLVATGLVYSTNWLICSGRLKDDQIVFTCIGHAAGFVRGTAFSLDINSTSAWRGGPAQQAPAISQEPSDRIAGLGSNVTVTVTATGPCPQFQWRRNGAAIPGATNSSLVLRRIGSSDAGAYSVLVRNFAGSVTSREARIEVADLSRPTVAFTAPLPAQRVTTNIVRVAGTATDNVAVVKVNLSVNLESVVQASGTNKWSTFATLVPGTNVLLAQAWDQADFASTSVSRTVFYAVPTRLVVNADGRGSFQPNLNGRWLEIGRNYTMTAIPASGWISAGWTGGAETSSARVRFMQEENLVLTALFVPNPYPPLAGIYRGLFSESPVIRPESSGSLSLTLAGSGAFSGALRSAGQLWPFTGRFDAAGQAHLAVENAGSNQWQIDLTLALDDGVNQISGTVRRSGWEAELLAERAVFNSRSNPAPFAPRQTFLVRGATDPALAGGGDGFGTVTTTRDGSAVLSGTLADNSAVTLTAPLLRAGTWPLYQSLYGGRGCLLGWLEFHTNSPAGFGGSAHWIRPANSNVVWHARGFTNISTFTGSAYVAPVSRTDRVLPLESGRAVFGGGPILLAFTNGFTLSPRGVATNFSANKLTLTIQPANGLFSGTVLIPGASSTTPIKGAVLQGYNAGGGVVLGPFKNGRMTIATAP